MRLFRQLSVLCSLIAVLFLCSCATAPRKYQPPDASKLKASTQKLSQEVDSAHAEARQAQASVSFAAAKLAHIKSEVAKLKDVPLALTNEINDLEKNVTDAQGNQVRLDQHLTEADKAKTQVEKDKTEYFAGSQKLADQATAENAHRITAEQKLSWYRWHFFLGWIILGTGIAACIFVAFLKLTGKLAVAGAAIASKIP